MRLFVALELDEGTRLAIATLQKAIAEALLRSGPSSPKWVRPDHMHLTLVFLGEIAETRVAELTVAIGADIPVPPFVVTFGGLGVFPPRGAPRVLWLGVRHGADEVVAVEREVTARIRRLGLPLEPRAFHPHLTLARWRTSRPSDTRRALATDHGGDVARVAVDHATLLQSRLSPTGPTYTSLVRATLTTCRS